MGIFDDIVQGINREIGKVQARSQEMMQTYSLNSQIRALEGKKTATLIEIGRLVFDRYQRDIHVPEETLQEKTKEIVGYEHEITVLQAEMESLKVQFDTEVPASQRSAAKAGYSPSPGFHCPHCDAPANKEKTFCPACGGELKAAKDGAGTEGNGGHASSAAENS